MQRRAPVPGAIDDVDLVAFLHEVLEPARPSVGGPHPIGALPAPAVHQDHRKRVAHLRGNHVLDVHLLAADEGPARRLGALDVHPHVTPLGDVERDLGAGARRAGLGREARRLSRTAGQWRQRRRRHAGDAERRRLPHELATVHGAVGESTIEIRKLL